MDQDRPPSDPHRESEGGVACARTDAVFLAVNRIKAKTTISTRTVLIRWVP